MYNQRTLANYHQNNPVSEIKNLLPGEVTREIEKQIRDPIASGSQKACPAQREEESDNQKVKATTPAHESSQLEQKPKNRREKEHKKDEKKKRKQDAEKAQPEVEETAKPARVEEDANLSIIKSAQCDEPQLSSLVEPPEQLEEKKVKQSKKHPKEKTAQSPIEKKTELAPPQPVEVPKIEAPVPQAMTPVPQREKKQKVTLPQSQDDERRDECSVITISPRARITIHPKPQPVEAKPDEKTKFEPQPQAEVDQLKEVEQSQQQKDVSFIHATKQQVRDSIRTSYVGTLARKMPQTRFIAAGYANSFVTRSPRPDLQ